VIIASPAIAQGTADSSDKPGSSSPISLASAHTASGLHERNPRYRLRKGDTFDLDFELSPEFNQTVAVQPDGFVKP
jgi:polysaccharide export outer membrane protein